MKTKLIIALTLLGNASISEDGQRYWQYAELDSGDVVAIYWDIIADDDEADNCCDWSSPSRIESA